MSDETQNPPGPEPAEAGREPAGAESTDAGTAEAGRLSDPIPGGNPAINPMLAGQGIGPARAFDPARDNPNRLHGARDRLRADADLRPGDLVERQIRPGEPPGGWVEFPAADGVAELRVRLAPIGANRQGVTLVAGHGEPVDPQLVRELQAGTVPARLIRREGGADA